MKPTLIPLLFILETKEEIQKYGEPNGLTLEMPELKNKTVLKVFKELPESILGDKYTESIGLIYKGEYLALYCRNREYRFGGGTLESCIELRDLILKHQTTKI